MNTARSAAARAVVFELVGMYAAAVALPLSEDANERFNKALDEVEAAALDTLGIDREGAELIAPLCAPVEVAAVEDAPADATPADATPADATPADATPAEVAATEAPVEDIVSETAV